MDNWLLVDNSRKVGDGIKKGKADHRQPKSLPADNADGGAAAAYSLSGRLSYCIANCDPAFIWWDVTAPSCCGG